MANENEQAIYDLIGGAKCFIGWIFCAYVALLGTLLLFGFESCGRVSVRGQVQIVEAASDVSSLGWAAAAGFIGLAVAVAAIAIAMAVASSEIGKN